MHADFNRVFPKMDILGVGTKTKLLIQSLFDLDLRRGNIEF